MRSRIFSLFLTVLIFTSSIQIFGFSHSEGSVTEGNSAPASETVICNFQDMAYGAAPKQTFDLNLPVDSRDEIGLVVYLHGGGWTGGDKATAKKSYSIFASNADYATAAINYRFAGEENADLYSILNDITTALQRIKNMAGGYGMNITKMVLCGHSAGGHLSLLYAYKYSSFSPIPVSGVFVSAPVPDLSADAFYKNNSLGDEKYMCSLMSKVCGVTFTPETRTKYKSLLGELSPVNFVTRASAPTVIIHGTDDKVAPYSATQLLDDVLTENKVMHEVITVEKGNHRPYENAEKKKYAEDLMTACIKEWFDIKPADTSV